METLKKIFPLSWKYTADVANLIIGIIVYIVAAVIAGVLIALATLITGWIPVVGGLVGWALGVVGGLIGLYVLVGIMIQVLVFTKVIKD